MVSVFEDTYSYTYRDFLPSLPGQNPIFVLEAVKTAGISLGEVRVW